MMIRLVLSTFLSHWRIRPIQCFTLVMGIALATALWTGIQAINSEVRASYDKAAQTFADTQFEILLTKEKLEFPTKPMSRCFETGGAFLRFCAPRIPNLALRKLWR